MQQRRLRLGDILDDYCPRERRITNHVVVAMIEDDVRQTRCTTCDAEHEYKDAKVPAPRRKNAGALAVPVQEDAVRVAHAPATPTDLPSEDHTLDVPADAVPAAALAEDAVTAVSADAPADDGDSETDEDDSGNRVDDDGPVHRRLIRATLPRPEGHVPERKEPDFTMRQPSGRDFNGNGNRPRHRGARHAQGGQQGGGQNRFGGQRQGAGGAPHGHGGNRQGNRPGQPGQNRGGGQPGGQNRGNGRKRGR